MLAQVHEFVRRVAAHHAAGGLHRAHRQAATLKDARIRRVNTGIGAPHGGLIPVKAIGVSHEELARPHQTTASTEFVPELGLHLVDQAWQLAIGADLLTSELRYHFLMGHAKHQRLTCSILEARQCLARRGGIVATRG